MAAIVLTPEVKDIIRAANDDGTPARALILFGRIAVPYSGDHAPDGHSPDHRGAWPADTYYADLDGEWTDEGVNVTAADRSETRNVPGDGKFDASSLPSDVELETGRIDVSQMSITGEDELALLKRYLDRNHDFRHRKGAFAGLLNAALIDDQFQSSVNPFAANGWRNFVPLSGAANVRPGRWFEELGTESILLAMAAGPGSYTGIGGVGTSPDFANRPSRAVFNLFSGSYLGDWDVPNSFLRAPLAAGEGSLGLASLWAGRPDVHLFPMALGETIGFCVRMTQNNGGARESGYAVGESVTARGAHIALMGDPTLRLHPVVPPENVLVEATPGIGAQMSWSGSTDEQVHGYKVWKCDADGAWYSIADQVSDTQWLDTAIVPGQVYRYKVQAIKRETSPTGIYWNRSQAVFASPIVAADSFWGGPRLSVVSVNDLAPIIQDSSIRLDRLPQPEFTDRELELRLRNVGSQPLTLPAPPDIAGEEAAYYRIEPQLAENTILPPGGERELTIQIDDAKNHRRAVTITFQTNDTVEPDFRFNLLPFQREDEVAQDYYSWIETHHTIDTALRSPSDDPDEDGVSNAEEYAYGGAPDTANLAEELKPVIQRKMDQETGEVVIAVTVRQLKDTTGNEGRGMIGRDYRIRDLRYILELSEDGNEWFAAGDEVIETRLPTDNGDGTVTVLSKTKETGGSGIPRHARVRVEIAKRVLTYSIWLQGYPDVEGKLADPLADTDGDGLPNLGEYALGKNPVDPDAVPFSAAIVDINPLLSQVTLSYQRRTSDASGNTPGAATDLSYGIEVSEDLQTWIPWDFGTQEIVETSENGFERANVKVFEPFEGKVTPARFVRVQIRLDSP